MRPTQLPIQWVVSWGSNGWDLKLTMKLTTHIQMLTLRMSGAILVLILYAFMVWTGITLLFYLYQPSNQKKFKTVFKSFLFLCILDLLLHCEYYVVGLERDKMKQVTFLNKCELYSTHFLIRLQK